MGFRNGKEEIYILVDGKAVLQSEVLKQEDCADTSFVKIDQTLEEEISSLENQQISIVLAKDKEKEDEVSTETLTVVVELKEEENEKQQDVEIVENIEKPVKKRGRPPGISKKK